MQNYLSDGMHEILMENFVKTDNIVNDMQKIIEYSHDTAYRSVNTILIRRNWMLGYRIAEEILQGKDRAEYGAEIIKKLAKELEVKYGKGFTKTNLYGFYMFYKTYPKIFQTVSGKSLKLLSWSHYAILLQVHDKEAREWYEREAKQQTWSVRTLQRNVSSQYYYRMLQTHKNDLTKDKIENSKTDYKTTNLLIKSKYFFQIFFS